MSAGVPRVVGESHLHRHLVTDQLARPLARLSVAHIDFGATRDGCVHAAVAADLGEYNACEVVVRPWVQHDSSFRLGHYFD